MTLYGLVGFAVKNSQPTPVFGLVASYANTATKDEAVGKSLAQLLKLYRTVDGYSGHNVVASEVPPEFLHKDKPLFVAAVSWQETILSGVSTHYQVAFVTADNMNQARGLTLREFQDKYPLDFYNHQVRLVRVSGLAKLMAKYTKN